MDDRDSNQKFTCKESTLPTGPCNDTYKICGKCREESDDDDSFVQCGQCKTWFHSYCSGLLEHLLDDLVESGEKDYICYTCLQVRNECKRQKTDRKAGQPQPVKAANDKSQPHVHHGALVNGTTEDKTDINRYRGSMVVQNASENSEIRQSDVTSFITALTARVASLEAANRHLNERVANLELQLFSVNICQAQTPMANGEPISDYMDARTVSPTNPEPGFDTEGIQGESAIPTEYMFRDQVKPPSQAVSDSAETAEHMTDDHCCAKEAQPHVHPNKEAATDILLIGDENITGILPHMLHEDLMLAKRSAQIIPDAVRCLEKTRCSQLKCLLLHVGMNDIRVAKNSDQVIHNYGYLVAKVQEKYPSAHLVVSLVPPWKDITLMYRRKQVNEFLCSISDTAARVTCVDNENLGEERPILIKAALYHQNGVFLKPEGTAILASNLKKAIETALELTNSDNTKGDDVKETDKTVKTTDKKKLQSGTSVSKKSGTSQGSTKGGLSTTASKKTSKAAHRATEKANCAHLQAGLVSYPNSVASLYRSNQWENPDTNSMARGAETSPAHMQSPPHVQQHPTYTMCTPPHPSPSLHRSPMHVQAVTITHEVPMQPVPTRQPMPMHPPVRMAAHAVIRQAVPTHPEHPPTVIHPTYARPVGPAVIRYLTPTHAEPMMNPAHMQHVPIGHTTPMQHPSPTQCVSPRQSSPMGQVVPMEHPKPTQAMPNGRFTPMDHPTVILVRHPTHRGQPNLTRQPMPRPNGQPIPMRQQTPMRQLVPMTQHTPMGQHAPMGQHIPMGQHTPTGQAIPMRQPSPMGQHTPMGQAVPMGQYTPMGMGQPTHMGQYTPMGQPTPMRQHTPMGQPVHMGQPIKQQTPMGQHTPMGQPIPMGQVTPTGQPIPTGQHTPTGQQTPKGQPTPK